MTVQAMLVGVAASIATAHASPAMAAAAPACAAPAPSIGATISGPVLQVIDRQTVCVALGPTPDKWVRLRLVGAPAADQASLMAAVFAKRLTCEIESGGAAAAGRCVLGASPTFVRAVAIEPAGQAIVPAACPAAD